MNEMVKVLVGTTSNGEMVFANINNEWDNFILNYDLVKPVKVEEVNKNGLEVYGDGIYRMRGRDYILTPIDLQYNSIDKYVLIHDSHGIQFKNFLVYMEMSRDFKVIFESDIEVMEEHLEQIDILPFNRFVLHTMLFYCGI